MSTVTLPLELVERLTKWRLCMSYNDSYFGEPEGELKRLTEEIERAAQPVAPTHSGEPVAWTSPDRLKRIAEQNRHVDTMWPASMCNEGDIPLYAAPQPAQPAKAGEALYTQADMERYGKCYADARDSRRAVALDGERATPSANWREKGEPDPHGNRYDCERAALTMGFLSDDALANGVFMHGNSPPDVSRIIASDKDYHQAIAWLTAAKDRILWLSRALERARAASPQATATPTTQIDEQITKAAYEQFGIVAEDAEIVAFARHVRGLPAQTARALTLPDRLAVPSEMFGLSRRYALGWNDCLDAIGAAQPAAGGDRG